MRSHFLILSIFIGFQISSAALTPVRFVDRSWVKSGWHYLIDDIDQAVTNTKTYYPHVAADLAKATQLQYSVGDTVEFYTYTTSGNRFEQIEAVCRKKSERTYIFAGVEEWQAGKIGQQGVENFYQAFEESTPASSFDPDQGIREILESYIGPTPNKSGDNYIYILIYDIDDDYNPGEGKNVYTAGYFLPYDQSDGSYSNKKDLLYIDCDPGDPASQVTASVVAHEFQHLLHYGMDADESSQNGIWVNEGASIYAEVLCGYGLRNPTPYLQHPERSLNVFSYESDSQIDYAKVGLWFYYIAEKFGAELVSKIVRNPLNGIEGVRSALQDHNVELFFEQIFSRFVMANLVNDKSMGDNGYFGYNTLVLPILPRIKKSHKSYPVADQLNHVTEYASHYFRFDARDSTAILYANSFSADNLRLQIYSTGEDLIDSIELDNDGYGRYGLSGIRETTDKLYLISSGLSGTSSYSYSVSSTIEDLNPPQLVDGPYESLPTGDAITIFWETDELATSIVEYGTSENYDNRVEKDSLTVSHRILLSALQPNTTYFYRVGSSDSKGNGPVFSASFRFSTASMNQHIIAGVQQAHSYGYQGRNLLKHPSGGLFIVFHDLRDDRRFIYYSQSQDEGKTWSPPIAVDTTLYYSGMPSLAIDENERLHTVWHAQANSDADPFTIYHSFSDDQGKSWSAPELISRSFTGGDQLYPFIAVDNKNQPHVVWNTVLYADVFEGDIYHAFSQDNGLTWQTDMEISDSDYHHCFVPGIDFDSAGKAYVFYSDGVFQEQTLNVFYTASEDYLEWQPAKKVTQSGVLYDGLISFVIDPFDRLHFVYADNFIPGDVRIMYSRLESGVWQAPLPIAQTSEDGNLSYPNISVDIEGNVYVAYEDELNNATLGKLANRIPADRAQNKLQKTQAANKKVFLTLYKYDSWQPPINLSNDPGEFSFPELPDFVDVDELDIILMKTIHASNYQIRHLNLSTNTVQGGLPPRVSLTSPEDGDTQISYLKEMLDITVQFDQRMAADSFIPQHVTVNGAASGLIKGELTYNSSQRMMQFRPEKDVQPNDEITVRLSGQLANPAGISLDGDRDAKAEGSPEDDFVWSFFTSGKDETAPQFTLGVLQNPVLTAYMDIYVIASEQLNGIPQLSANEQSLSLQTINAEKSIYKADYKLEQSQTIQLAVNGTDLAGNAGQSAKNFAAQRLQTGQENWVESVDKALHLYVPASGIAQDTWITIVKENTNEADGTYTIGPSSLRLDRAAELSYYLSDSNGLAAVFERKKEEGGWQSVPTVEKDRVFSARITRFGTYRISKTVSAVPEAFTLIQNYPNPFSLHKGYTTLGFSLPQKARIEIAIYDILGRHVKTLVKRVKEAGIHYINWDGTDKTARQVPSGVYLYQLKTSHTILTEKMIVLR
ncbi:T9SS type A sorting domain-containing protein [candidate division KSB1 bacterium]|nr:T9SS type A sorting domain-containing protein [candidate division KSB1 bacterium]